MAAIGANLAASFEGSLVQSPDFSITLDRYTWKVHLDRLAKSSEFFANILKNENFVESQKKAVTLHDDEPELFANALQFMYYHEYGLSREARVRYMIEDGKQSYNHTGASVNDILAGGLGNPKKRSAESERSFTNCEKVLALHFIAQKYSISDLAIRTRDTILEWSIISAKHIKDIFSEYIDTLHVADPKIKQHLGRMIANNYAEIRARSTESAKEIYGWLKLDPDLTLEVCEELHNKRLASTTPRAPGVHTLTPSYNLSSYLRGRRNVASAYPLGQFVFTGSRLSE